MSKQDTLNQSHSTSTADAPSQRRVRLAGYFVGVVLVFGLTALGFWITTVVRGNSTVIATNTPEVATATATVPLALQRPIVTEQGLAEKIGVKILYVAVTGGGGLIDLRFQVIDPNKALALHTEGKPPMIIEATTGLIVDQLFMGHSHTQGFTAGQTYYFIFDNPDTLLQRGDTVSVLLGDAEVDDIVVK